MDKLLYRYKDMSYIMSLEADEVIALIDKASEKTEEERAWQMWLVQYSNMDKKSFVPFSEFHKKATKPSKISKRSAEDILNEAQKIREEIKAQQ